MPNSAQKRGTIGFLPIVPLNNVASCLLAAEHAAALLFHPARPYIILTV